MKESDDIKIKSYVWIYWIVWAFITLLTMYLKHMYFKENGKMRFNLLVSYVLVIWIPIMILGVYEFYRLSNYIQKAYPVEVESMRNASFGLLPISTIMSFADKNSLNDTMLRQLRNNYKNFYMFTIVVFVSFMFVAISLIFYERL